MKGINRKNVFTGMTLKILTIELSAKYTIEKTKIKSNQRGK